MDTILNRTVFGKAIVQYSRGIAPDNKTIVFVHFSDGTYEAGTYPIGMTLEECVDDICAYLEQQKFYEGVHNACLRIQKPVL